MRGIVRFGSASVSPSDRLVSRGYLRSVVESDLGSPLDSGEYGASVVEGLRAKGASAAAIDAKVAEMREMAEMYKNPLYRMPMTFVEIFPVGLAVALVSAALLRNPRLLPAAR